MKIWDSVYISFSIYSKFLKILNFNIIFLDYENLKSGKQHERRNYNSRVRIGPTTNFEMISEDDEESDFDRFIPMTSQTFIPMTSTTFIPVTSPVAENENEINEAIENNNEENLERGMEGNKFQNKFCLEICFDIYRQSPIFL